jgi:hypothetical protein
MNEWLTTGQMIDRLKVGEVAESEWGHRVTIFHEEGDITFIDKNGTRDLTKGVNGSFVITSAMRKAKWRILPRYVSFEEAMKALREGKKVRFHVREGKSIPFTSQSYLENIYSVHGCSLTWEYLFQDKWTIEE